MHNNVKIVQSGKLRAAAGAGRPAQDRSLGFFSVREEKQKKMNVDGLDLT